MNKKVVLSLICGFAFLIILPIAWFNSVGELLYSPAICSHTEDVGNYGKYDNYVSEVLSLNGEGYLPKAIPSEAKNAQYYYQYEKASADTIHISVSWDSSEDEIQKLKCSTEWEINENGKTIIFLSNKTPTKSILQPYLQAVIMLDETNNTITYIVANKTEVINKAVRK